VGCSGSPHFDAGDKEEAAMKITIEKVQYGWQVTAEEDGRLLLNDGLGADEALWSVAQVMNEVKPRYLKSPMKNIQDEIRRKKLFHSNPLAHVFGGEGYDE